MTRLIGVWLMLACVINSMYGMAKGSDCLSDKFSIIEDHTACLPMSEDADEGDRGVTETDADAIVTLHNKLRASIKDATDMQVMIWDDELSAIAQKWADYCGMKHDKGDQREIPGRFRVGQNLGYNHGSWNSTVNSWFNEQSKFHYGDSSIMNFEDVGHFTQVVWANTTKVGCGYTKCSGKGKFYVCNYGPSGNIDWSRPYARGTQCSKCSTGGKCITSGSNQGLCDCKGRSCYNGGSMDLDTCTCKCLSSTSLYSPQLDCALNCTKTEDNPYACVTGCVKNLANYCPHACDYCPYGAFDYKEGTGEKRENTGNKISTDKWLLLTALPMLWMRYP